MAQGTSGGSRSPVPLDAEQGRYDVEVLQTDKLNGNLETGHDEGIEDKL